MQCYECNVMNVMLWMQCDASINARRWKITRLGIEQNRRITEFVKDRDSTLMGDKTGSSGNQRVVYYHIDSCMKTKRQTLPTIVQW